MLHRESSPSAVDNRLIFGRTSGRRIGRRRTHRVMGLFAGIGGLELGLERAGHRTVFLCEKDDAARRVLKDKLLARRRGVPIHPDVREVARVLSGNGAQLIREVTLIGAGFPCQDLSQAGRTSGIGGANSGLVSSLFSILDVFRANGRTPWVVLENVPFLLHLDRGAGMTWLTKMFESRSYAWAYRVVDSRAFGVPQRRLRVFLVACDLKDGDPRRVLLSDDAGQGPEPVDDGAKPVGFYWTEGNRGIGWAVDAVPALKVGSSFGIASPPAVWLPSGEIVTPTIMAAERLQGFSGTWTSAAEAAGEKQRWRLVGNAVTVPAAEWLGRNLARPFASYARGGRRLGPNERWPKAAWNVGAGPHEALVSAWPVRKRSRLLLDVLRRNSRLLSARAAAGFLARYERSGLTGRPRFVAALRSHIAAISASHNDPSADE